MVAADSGFEDLFSVISMAKLPWKCLSDTNLREFEEIRVQQDLSVDAMVQES